LKPRWFSILASGENSHRENGRETASGMARFDALPHADDPLNACDASARNHRQNARRPPRSGLHSIVRSLAQCSDGPAVRVRVHALPTAVFTPFQEGSIQTYHDPFSKI
jgi:hypothetical protein